MSSKFTPEIVAEVLNRHFETDQAGIAEGSSVQPFDVQRVEIELGQERKESDPLRIGTPFKSIYVDEATDTTCVVYLKPNTRDSFQSPIPFKLNASWSRSLPVSGAWLHWPAQPGKKMVLYVFVNSEFRSGSQISVTSGGISVSDGSSVETGPNTVLPSGSATVIAPAKSNRKTATLQNKSSGIVYVGDATVANTGPTQGIEIPPDAIFKWANTGALYGYSVAGGTVLLMEES